MTQEIDELTQGLEDTVLEIMSIPEVDLNLEGIELRAEQLHELTLKIMKLETVSLHQLQAALAAEGEKVQRSLETLDEAIKANSDYVTMLHSIDYGLQILNSFFMRLL